MKNLSGLSKGQIVMARQLKQQSLRGVSGMQWLISSKQLNCHQSRGCLRLTDAIDMVYISLVCLLFVSHIAFTYFRFPGGDLPTIVFSSSSFISVAPSVLSSVIADDSFRKQMLI